MHKAFCMDTVLFCTANERVTSRSRFFFTRFKMGGGVVVRWPKANFELTAGAQAGRVPCQRTYPVLYRYCTVLVLITKRYCSTMLLYQVPGTGVLYRFARVPYRPRTGYWFFFKFEEQSKQQQQKSIYIINSTSVFSQHNTTVSEKNHVAPES